MASPSTAAAPSTGAGGPPREQPAVGQATGSTGKRQRPDAHQSSTYNATAPKSPSTSIATAVRKRRTMELSRLLAGKADPNEVDAKGETPLFKAASRGDVATAFLLLEGRADPMHRSRDGHSAIDLAQGAPMTSLLTALTPSADLAHAGPELVEAAIEVLPRDLKKRCRDLAEECAAISREGRWQHHHGLLDVSGEGDEAERAALEIVQCIPRSLPRATPTPMVTVALEDYIPADMDNTLEDLLFRDITPEDYDMLLQLDEDLTPTTASCSSMDGLQPLDVEDVEGQKCVICQCAFDGDATCQVVGLPCQHPFHRDCIKKWLLERSEVCPLCGDKAFS